MAKLKLKDINKVGSNIEILTINTVKPNAPECYSLNAVKSVIPTYTENIGTSLQDRAPYPWVDLFMITVTFHNEHENPSIKFDLREVNNQPTWTPDLVGLIQAVADICGWQTQAAGGGVPFATEATLQGVLQAIQNHQDFEMKLVRDTGNGDKVVCEVAEYDEGTDTYSYSYKDVGGAAYVPTGPLEYLDPEATLLLVLTELQSLNTPVTGVVPGLIIANAPGPASVPAGKRSVSIMNTGANNATVLGQTLKPGLSVTFPELSLRDTYGAISYDALTSELTISTVG